MCLQDIDPNAIVNDEMLKIKEDNFILVITNYNKSYEEIRYMGKSEPDGFKKYKDILHKDKILVKASVRYSDLFKEKYKTEFIVNYDILEILKET
jgi:hypothetical protein